jgi:hypothetical protein
MHGCKNISAGDMKIYKERDKGQYSFGKPALYKE